MKLRPTKKSFRNYFEKYSEIFWISVKAVLYYPQKLQATLIIVPFRIFILLWIYRYAFSYVGKPINGITADIAIWSIALYHLLLFTQFRGIFRVITDDIRRGDLEVAFIRPYDYLVYKFWEHLGNGVLNLLVSLVVVLPLLWFFTGGLPTALTFNHLLGLISLIVGGTLVSAGIYILVALPALWIDDATAFFWIVDKGILIFGGAYIPLALFPEAFQIAATLTPFGAAMFVTQLFNPGFVDKWMYLFLVQVVWVVILFSAIGIVFERAQKRLTINGG